MVKFVFRKAMRNFNILDNFIAGLRERHIQRFINKESVICDIGCGDDASMLIRLAPRVKVGIGINTKLAVNRASLPSNIEIHELSLPGSIPMADSSADIVSMLAVLEHLTEVDKILLEVRRILKSGGIFFLTTPTPAAKPLLEFLAFKLGIISPEEIRDHKHYFSKEELIDKLIRAGFQQNKIKHEFFEFGLNQRVTAIK